MGEIRRSSLFLTALAVMAAACGPSIPPRYVLERNVGEFQYRRYQEVVDVEFPIEGNRATGHTATYLERRAHVPSDARDVQVTTAFVTVYERGASLAAEVRERLDTLNTYELAVERVSGEWVWVLDGGDVPWILWVSGRHLVKLGGSHDAMEDADYGVPEDLLDAYTDLFPSDLDERGQAREGTDSYGPSQIEVADSEELEIPSQLRDGL